MDDPKSYLIIPDTHYPFEDRAACAAVLKYAEETYFDGLIHLGDFMDINSVSSHNEGRPLAIEGERLAEDYAYANKRLDEWESAIRANNTRATVTLLKGNHEWRVDRYVEKHPPLEGLIEVDVGLMLKHRGISWVRCVPDGELLKLGHARFTHGMWCNAYHAARHVRDFGTNIIYGHTHQVQLHSLVQHGKDKTLAGVSLGCLCKYDMPYLRGKPTAWQHAFGVVHVRPDGFFNLSIVNIFSGEFVAPDGRFFTWRDRLASSKKSSQSKRSSKVKKMEKSKVRR